MPSCRSTSFYVAPGVALYFSKHTVCARHPETGALVGFTHRDSVHWFIDNHPNWDRVLLVGPPGGADNLAQRLVYSPGSIDMYRTSKRTIEGRRPEEAADYAVHRWTVGGLERAGGAKQVAETLFPQAGSATLKAVRGAIKNGDIYRVQVLGAAWRAGLLDDPHMAVRLLTGPALPVRVPVDPMLEPLFATLAQARLGGVSIDVEQVLAEASNVATVLDAGAVRLLAGHPDTSPGALTSLASNENKYVREHVARNPKTPPEVLKHLASDGNPNVRKAAAENEFTPPEALRDLVNNGDTEICFAVARNPSTPPDVFDKLANHEDKYVRGAVARNQKTPPEVLKKLADDKDKSIRELVAQNPKTPPEVLAILATGKDDGPRANAAQNEDFRSRVETLAKLVTGESGSARGTTAKNQASEADIIATIATAESARIRASAARNPNTPPEVLRDLANSKDNDLCANVAVNPSTPPDVLRDLATDGGRELRSRVARNPSTPPEVIKKLANSEDFGIRQAVAANESASPETLAILADDKDAQVRSRLAGNPKTPPGVLDKLAKDIDKETRRAVVRNPSTSPEVLKKLAGDNEAEVRLGVAINKSTPPETLAILANDEVPEVLDAALRNPALPLDLVPAAALADHQDLVQIRQVLAGLPVGVQASDRMAGAVFVDAGFDPVKSFADLDVALKEKIVHRRNRTIADSLEGSKGGFDVSVIRTVGELRENANYMGNCTAGYEDRMRRGQDLMYSVVDKASGETYNVNLRRRGGRWKVGEINSRFNDGVDDETGERIAALFETATGRSTPYPWNIYDG